jgi:sucrose phosphorylase
MPNKKNAKNLQNKVQLIAYPNRIGKTIKDLSSVLHNELKDAVGGVHVLPFYPSNADDGFSPLTHKEVDPEFGTWEDIGDIAKDFDLCVDLTLNHISDESEQFQDYIAKGEKSKWAGLFINVDRDLPDLTHDDLAKIHIRKEKEPFREFEFADGKKGRVWSTFTDHQIDLNYNNKITFELMEDYLDFLIKQGVKLFRLDAFGYITVELGTNCFLVEPDVYDKLEWFRDKAQAGGAEILPEVHAHYSYQFAMSNRDMYAYGFALPPLMLYTFFSQDSTYLKHWLRFCSSQQVTVLDTHDGICIPDVKGLLPDDKLEEVVDDVAKRSADLIYLKAASNLHSVGAIYQLTTTFYDAMRRNDDAYICARAIQMFTPGIPQVYYVGLVAGENQAEYVEETGDPRSGNRQKFSLNKYKGLLQKEVSQRLIKLMEFRNKHKAFDGEFQLQYSNDSSLSLKWVNGKEWAHLFIDLNYNSGTITYTEGGKEKEMKV